MYKAEKKAQEYQRHPYADEGDADVSADLDVLTIPDEDTFQSLLNTLTPPALPAGFHILAAPA